MAGPVVHSPFRNSEIENSALNHQNRSESSQSNPINVIQDDFMINNELSRITHQQAVAESMRRSMQEQLKRITESMKTH